MEKSKRCKNWTGYICVSGRCSVALAEQYEIYAGYLGMKCNDCIEHKKQSCETCYFDGKCKKQERDEKRNGKK